MLIVIRETYEDMARAAADIYLADCARVARERRDFTVAVSGGRTPAGFFSVLAAENRLTPELWRKTQVFWVDERCVPESDPASNYGNAKRVLLDRVPLLPEHIHPMPGESQPEEGARRYEEELMRIFGLGPGSVPRFDLVVLGVGADGHTASLFPGTDLLQEKHRLVVPVKGGSPDLWRLTLTFPVLNAAAHVMILAAGTQKARVAEALLGRSGWRPPARRIRPDSGALTLLLDRAAAGGLNDGGRGET